MFLDISGSQLLFAASTLCIGFFVYMVMTSVVVIVYNVYFHPLAKFPGSLLRSAFHFGDCWSLLRGNAHVDTQLLHDRYGPIVRITPNALSFNTAQAWKDIYGIRVREEPLSKDPRIYDQGDATNIINSDHTNHARIRKLLSHAFSDNALREQEPILTAYFDLLISRLKDEVDGSAAGLVDIMSWYNFTSFDIIGDLTLGESFHALENGQLHNWMRNMFQSVKFLAIMRFAATYPIINRVFNFLMSSIPSVGAKRKSHFQFVREKTESRLDSNTNHQDFTTYILRHNDERGMTREEIISNSSTLLLAGSETVATALSGATFCLLTNPVVLETLQAEIRATFQHEDEITLLSVGSPGRLPYLDAVLNESLRIYPPVPSELPRLTGPDGKIIDGKFVPPNTSLGVHQWAAHHSGANFADPSSFVPERWLADAPELYRNDSKAALQPFSIGARNCLGRNLANFEMRSILTRVLWHFDITLCEQSRDWMQQKAYILWDKPPLWVKLKHRA